MIIIDDLMSLSAKDPRINELFTECSHHRNLSVISILERTRLREETVNI